MLPLLLSDMTVCAPWECFAPLKTLLLFRESSQVVQCLQKDNQKKRKDEEPQVQLDIEGCAFNFHCKTDCTVGHVALPARVPSVEDSFTVIDLQG